VKVTLSMGQGLIRLVIIKQHKKIGWDMVKRCTISIGQKPSSGPSESIKVIYTNYFDKGHLKVFHVFVSFFFNQ